ncbi:MAG: ABC transporter ATP-binding protein [Verrucomicrobia bacterium]|nr:ABC transporter ATP-binding protein [Verrucomicrobiota bacterium]
MAIADTRIGPAGDGAAAIELDSLVKRFGSTAAVNGLSFRVERGDLFGFIGANGAGKTTTLRILATFLTPDAGRVQLLGHDVVTEARAVRHLIGYMPEHFGLNREMKVAEYLDFFGAAYSLSREQRTAAVTDALERVRLAEKRDALIGTLSRGQQQRVALARVLVHDPQVLLLDEPASGLDPRARMELLEVLKDLRRAGKTVFLSSHILSELEDVCNRLAIVDKGRLAFCGTLEELRRRIHSGRPVYVEVTDRVEEARTRLAACAEVESVEPSGRGLRVRLKPDVADHGFLAERLVAGGLRLAVLREETAPLEELFIRLTSEEREKP